MFANKNVLDVVAIPKFTGTSKHVFLRGTVFRRITFIMFSSCYSLGLEKQTQLI